MRTALVVFASILLQLAIVTPLFVWAWRGNRPADRRPLFYFAVVFAVTQLLTASLANVTLFPGQHWNWAGKAAALAAAILFLFVLPSFRPRDFGVATPRFEGAGPIVAICALYFALRLALGWRLATGGFDLETTLFQATLPGLAEELVFRGLLLGLLNRLFPTPRWTLVGVSFGWAAVLTSLLFGLVHGVTFPGGLVPSFNAFAMLRTAFDGLLLALLAERTRSVWPSVALHNALNLIGNH